MQKENHWQPATLLPITEVNFNTSESCFSPQPEPYYQCEGQHLSSHFDLYAVLKSLGFWYKQPGCKWNNLDEFFLIVLIDSYCSTHLFPGLGRLSRHDAVIAVWKDRFTQIWALCWLYVWRKKERKRASSYIKKHNSYVGGKAWRDKQVIWWRIESMRALSLSLTPITTLSQRPREDKSDMLDNMTFKESLLAKVNSINSYVFDCQETAYHGIGNSLCNIYSLF